MDYIDVKKYRIAMGLTQNSFAKQVGISQPTIAKIESNLIPAKKYTAKIMSIVNLWKNDRIVELNKEIEFVRNL